ncbi:MAG: hypothetical protein Q7S53_05285 [bacterium]|nr:hypothetical protein [bacterium]
MENEGNSFEENVGFSVAGTDEKEGSPFSVEQKEEEKTIEQYRAEAQKMIDDYQRFFVTFARDVSLKFKVSDAFYINLENGEVNLDAEWFADKDCSMNQIKWATLHEISHFHDLVGDSEGTLKNFEYIMDQAKKTGAEMMQKWEDKYGKSDPEFIERLKKQKPASRRDKSKTMNSVESGAYKIHHTFYNILDDICVNRRVSDKAATFERGTGGGEEISRLYAEKLFEGTDYTDKPRHLQLMYKLLREEMVPDQGVEISPEVEKIFEETIKFKGKEYTLQEMVDYIVSDGLKAGQRYFVIKKTLEPIFESLLKKDLDEWEPEKPEKMENQPSGDGGGGGQGASNPFEVDYDEFGESNPDQLSEDDIREWLDKEVEEKEQEEEEARRAEEEDSKSAEEKAKERHENMDREWCEQNGVEYRKLQNFRKIEQEIAPHLKELSELWEKIIFGSSKDVRTEMKGHYKTGSELDVQKAVEEWPTIEKGDLDKVRVMKKMKSQEVLVDMPELIRVRLGGDLSGSMSFDSGQKKHVLAQCFVLVMSSLREFNTKLNYTRSRTKSKLNAETEAWVFGNYAKKIKSFGDQSDSDRERVEIINIVDHLKGSMGGTADDELLRGINASLSQQDRENISKKKVMDIFIEVTDGGSDSATQTRSELDKLLKTGVIARAFQIGEVDSDERQTFEQVWNEDRKKRLGEEVGVDIGNLIPAMTELLKEYLSNIKL